MTVFRSDDPLAVIYGSVGLLLVVLLWLYLMWIFLLVGVEVAYVLQNFSSLLEAEEAEREAQSTVPRRAALAQLLETASLLASSFVAGEGPVSETDLRAQTGLRVPEQLAVLEVLRELGWVVGADEACWILAKPLDQLTLLEAAEAWQESTSPNVHSSAERRLGEVIAGALPETLADWLSESSAPESA